MPDRKFEREYDRQAVLLDYKQRIIDLTENNQPLPDVAWDAEPVRYFKLNLEWCKILAGWIDWLEDEAGWRDAEGDNHPGIQAFLAFEVGIQEIPMSPEDFKQALYEGLYKWTNDVAKQIVSGGIGGFAVDEDGNVTVGGDEDGGTPDDPDTPQDESAEARSGGAIGIRIGYNKFYDELIGYIDNGLAVPTIMQRLNAVYKLNETMEAAVTEFRTDYLAPIPVIEEFSSTLDAHLYCEDTTLQGVASYIVGLAVTANEIETALLINGGFQEEQISDWYNRGAAVPSTDYLAYPCVPIETEEFELDMSTGNVVQFITSGIWKKGHRFLIEASGSYVDSDLPDLVHDAMYFHTLSTGAKTFSSLGFNSSGGVTAPLQAEVPYSPSHVYRFTVDKSPTALDNICIISRDNGAMATPGVSGILTIKVTDLGEFA